jgi:orotate phosphoribosyltransferase
MHQLFGPAERAQLARLLRKHSVRTGSFRLASGKTSDVYCDVKQTSLLGEGAWLLGLGLHQLALAADPAASAAGGLTLGADPLVTAIAIAGHHAQRPMHAIIVRKLAKGHGTRRACEMPASVQPGDHVVAVEDVVTSGGSMLQAIEHMRDAGLIVSHGITVVDRRDHGATTLAAAGVLLHSLFSLDELRALPE